MTDLEIAKFYQAIPADVAQVVLDDLVAEARGATDPAVRCGRADMVLLFLERRSPHTVVMLEAQAKEQP